MCTNPGRHIYDVLACKIEQIHVSYSFTGKVRVTITDNSSNFVKAFLLYSLLDSLDTAVTIVEDAEEETEGVTFEDVDELLTLNLEETNNDDDLTQVQYESPPHYRCATHKMNLIASKDVLTSTCHLPPHPEVCTAALLLKALLYGIRQVDPL